MPAPLVLDLISYLDQSVTAYHAVINTEKELISKGFIRLEEEDEWNLGAMEKYYVIRGESALMAWQMGNGDKAGLRLIGAHTDSPGLRLKPHAHYSKSGYIQLGVEIYGGPLLASWMDRDLSLAGRVIIKDQEHLKILPFKADDPLLSVPQLAIHLNREVNEKGLILNKQKHMPPILGLEDIHGDPLEKDIIKKMLSDKLDVDARTIVNWELECYDTQKAALSGLKQELIASGRIDNLTMCHASLKAITEKDYSCPQTTMIAFFDNEEIGSSTSKGAASSFLRDIVQRVIDHDGSRHALQRGLANSFCISADGAHAIHPNYSEYHDPQHEVKMNNGPVIKVNANHRYATSGMTSAVFKQLAGDVDVPVQEYIHKTDLPCGSTIGPITESGLGIPVVDVGNAMLSMHSIRETAGVDDHEMMINIMQRFFTKDDLYAV